MTSARAARICHSCPLELEHNRLIQLRQWSGNNSTFIYYFPSLHSSPGEGVCTVAWGWNCHPGASQFGSNSSVQITFVVDCVCLHYRQINVIKLIYLWQTSPKSAPLQGTDNGSHARWSLIWLATKQRQQQKQQPPAQTAASAH